VPLLFPTVITSLFFLGRSIGLSPTSTIIADHSLSVDIKAFLPGKLNLLDLINYSSTRWTILHTWTLGKKRS
jgi:hypothetical protein